MRFIDIPSFPQPIEITNIEHLLRTRLSQKIVLWPCQGISMLGYMAHPDDPEARLAFMALLRGWSSDSAVVPIGIRQMHLEWARVGDLFNLHHDMSAGGHQERRGGASMGKAITVAEAGTKAWGSSHANLWQAWGSYKDVAPLVAAATIVSGDALARFKQKGFGEFGAQWADLQPLSLTMLVPDLVLALALHFQKYGLSQVPHAQEEPLLSSDTLWRIPDAIGVIPIAPPVRKIDAAGLAALRERRAGNRGNHHKRASGAPRPQVPKIV
jgi:hypothetical protein